MLNVMAWHPTGTVFMHFDDAPARCPQVLTHCTLITHRTVPTAHAVLTQHIDHAPRSNHRSHAAQTHHIDNAPFSAHT